MFELFGFLIFTVFNIWISGVSFLALTNLGFSTPDKEQVIIGLIGAIASIYLWIYWLDSIDITINV